MNKETCAVVVTFNRKRLLRECLNGILSQTRRPDAILVVDNASQDGTLDMLRREFPQVEILPIDRNVGGAGGFCHGITWAYRQEYDWIWLIDDDAEPLQDTLEHLVQALRKLDDVGFVCSRVIGTNGQSMNVPVIETTPSNNGYPQWDIHLDKGVVGVSAATFVSILLKREIVTEIGLPIKEFFMWGDDLEYTRRISKIRPCYLVGNSVAVHKRVLQRQPDLITEEDPKRIANHYYMIRNTMYVTRKYESLIDYIKLLLYIFTYIPRLTRTNGNAWKRFNVLTRAFAAGLFFRPEIESASPDLDETTKKQETRAELAKLD